MNSDFLCVIPLAFQPLYVPEFLMPDISEVVDLTPILDAVEEDQSSKIVEKTILQMTREDADVQKRLQEIKELRRKNARENGKKGGRPHGAKTLVNKDVALTILQKVDVVAKFVELIEHGHEKTKLEALKYLVDRVYGKAKQAVALENPDGSNIMSGIQVTFTRPAESHKIIDITPRTQELPPCSST